MYFKLKDKLINHHFKVGRTARRLSQGVVVMLVSKRGHKKLRDVCCPKNSSCITDNLSSLFTLTGADGI